MKGVDGSVVITQSAARSICSLEELRGKAAKFV